MRKLLQTDASRNFRFLQCKFQELCRSLRFVLFTNLWWVDLETQHSFSTYDRTLARCFATFPPWTFIHKSIWTVAIALGYSKRWCCKALRLYHLIFPGILGWRLSTRYRPAVKYFPPVQLVRLLVSVRVENSCWDCASTFPRTLSKVSSYLV